jgi:CRP-like cAMP-binding protein
MRDIIPILKNCIIFKGFNDNSIEEILSKIELTICDFSKDQYIAIEGDNCNSLGIVIAGEVEIKKIFASGKNVTLAKLSEGNIFGEVIVFSKMSKYPSTIVAASNVSILFISKQNIITLCSNNATLLNNFMGLLSNKILMLNKKLTNLSYDTLRQKIASFLLDNYKINKNLTFTINASRKEMAEELGVLRPSLSRELINMQNEGIVDFHKNSFKILDVERLESIIMGF